MQTGSQFSLGPIVRVAAIIAVFMLVCVGAFCLWLGPTRLRAFWGAKQFLEARYGSRSTQRLKLVLSEHERFAQPPHSGRFVFKFDFDQQHGSLEARYHEQADGLHLDYAMLPR